MAGRFSTLALTVRAGFALALANLAERVAQPGLLKRAPRVLSGVDDSRGWWPILRHLNFQTNVEVNRDSVLAQSTVFSCITLIAADIGKLRAKLMELLGGVWQETASPAFSPVLRRPNHYQTWQQFIEQWVISLLTAGNTYVLKQRDQRQVVVAMYVLDPQRCRPLVADDGSVYYALGVDNLSQVFEPRDGADAAPASEIIHARINCLFHPLVGLSPIFACGLAATQGLKIIENMVRFFENMSRPSGILTHPEHIPDALAAEVKRKWEENFQGNNLGRVAILGDGVKYEATSINPVDAQLVEQLKMSAEQVCGPFHVPAYMVNAAPVPPNNNVEALRLDYYQLALQYIIEGIENGLDEGLGIGPGQPKEGKTLGVELDVEALMRMDSKSQMETLSIGVEKAITAPNEARAKLGRLPKPGGDALYLQQQNFSLEALAKRDASADPFGKATAPAPAPMPPADAGSKALQQALDALRDAEVRTRELLERIERASTPPAQPTEDVDEGAALDAFDLEIAR